MPAPKLPERPPRKRLLKLGSQGKIGWLDLSDYVVHFTKGEDGYETMLAILSRRVVRRGPLPFGCAVGQKGLDMETQRAVCLSEIPLGFLQRIVERRRSSYGIGFHKQFVLRKGGGPLWYLQLGTPQQKAIKQLMKRASTPRLDAEDPIWRLTPFIDFPSGRPFTYDFRWEREWRVAGDLHFEIDEVAFLFLPDHQHDAAWRFFEDARNSNAGPGYFCPYIDPKWNSEVVARALSEAAKRNPPPFRPRPSWYW